MEAIELQMALQLLLAVSLGAVLGWEREQLDKPAGLRTHALVVLGSALFTIVSRSGFLGIVDVGFDPSRVASAVVTGMGFIGAGVILHQRDRVRGLTTAAGIWLASAIGVAVGVEFYVLAVVATILGLIVLRFLIRIEPAPHDDKPPAHDNASASQSSLTAPSHHA